MTFEIRTLAKGEKITEPGFYSIPIEQHHNQPCDGVSVTSSVLRTMHFGSPSDVWTFSKLNPDCLEKPETDALRLGKAMASFIELGEAALDEQVRVLPAEKPNRPTEAQLKLVEEFEAKGNIWVVPEGAPRKPSETMLKAEAEGKAKPDVLERIALWEPVLVGGAEPVTIAEMDAHERRKAAKAFWEASDADPRTVITSEQWDLLSNMGKALAADPAAMAALSAAPEVTMAHRDEATGLWLLARPDQTSFNGMITDYKKMTARGGYFTTSMVDRRIQMMGYDMQMAFAKDAFEALTGETPSALGLVCQCEAPPYHVIVRDLPLETAEEASFLNRMALNNFAECLASGDWPGPGAHVGSFMRSEGQAKWIREQMNIFYGAS